MNLKRIVPMLPVRKVAESLPFYEKLGFEVEKRNDDWGWAMIRCGDCRIMLDQSIRLHPGIPKTSVLYLYPENLQEFRTNAVERGLTLPDLETTFYGMTEFRIEDPDGNRLWIGQESGNSAEG